MKASEQISIIIPTLNEAKNIALLIHHLLKYGEDTLCEIIVIDAGSKDRTIEIAKQAGAITFLSPKPGRAFQMNYGVEKAKGDILYFVHSDTIPPPTFIQDIKAALAEDFPIGCFRFKFDSPRSILKINSYFTRFDKMWCRGGDQTLFVKRSLFEELKGYKKEFKIMEEYDFIARARKDNPFKIIPKNVLVSARKYNNNSYLKVQIANMLIFNMYRFGFSQQQLVDTYKRMLNAH